MEKSMSEPIQGGKTHRPVQQPSKDQDKGISKPEAAQVDADVEKKRIAGQDTASVEQEAPNVDGAAWESFDMSFADYVDSDLPMSAMAMDAMGLGGDEEQVPGSIQADEEGNAMADLGPAAWESGGSGLDGFLFNEELGGTDADEAGGGKCAAPRLDAPPTTLALAMLERAETKTDARTALAGLHTLLSSAVEQDTTLHALLGSAAAAIKGGKEAEFSTVAAQLAAAATTMEGAHDAGGPGLAAIASGFPTLCIEPTYFVAQALHVQVQAQYAAFLSRLPDALRLGPSDPSAPGTLSIALQARVNAVAATLQLAGQIDARTTAAAGATGTMATALGVELLGLVDSAPDQEYLASRVASSKASSASKQPVANAYPSANALDLPDAPKTKEAPSGWGDSIGGFMDYLGSSMGMWDDSDAAPHTHSDGKATKDGFEFTNASGDHSELAEAVDSTQPEGPKKGISASKGQMNTVKYGKKGLALGHARGESSAVHDGAATTGERTTSSAGVRLDSLDAEGLAGAAVDLDVGSKQSVDSDYAARSDTFAAGVTLGADQVGARSSRGTEQRQGDITMKRDQSGSVGHSAEDGFSGKVASSRSTVIAHPDEKGTPLLNESESMTAGYGKEGLSNSYAYSNDERDVSGHGQGYGGTGSMALSDGKLSGNIGGHQSESNAAGTTTQSGSGALAGDSLVLSAGQKNEAEHSDGRKDSTHVGGSMIVGPEAIGGAVSGGASNTSADGSSSGVTGGAFASSDGKMGANAGYGTKDDKGNNTGSVSASGMVDFNEAGRLEAAAGSVSAGKGPVMVEIGGGFQAHVDEPQLDPASRRWRVSYAISEAAQGAIGAQGGMGSAQIGAQASTNTIGERWFDEERAANRFRLNPNIELPQSAGGLDKMEEGDRVLFMATLGSGLDLSGNAQTLQASAGVSTESTTGIEVIKQKIAEEPAKEADANVTGEKVIHIFFDY